MLCPHCKVTPLTVVNNNYYCPSCKFYIGAVGSTKQTVPTKVELKPLINDVLITPEIALEEKKNARSNKLKIVAGILGLLLFVQGWVIVTTANSYLDWQNFCRIDIIDSTQKTQVSQMKDTINLLRKNDQSSYQILCSHIKRIGVNGCDENSNKCYIQGYQALFFKDPLYANAETSSTNRAVELRAFLKKVAAVHEATPTGQKSN